MDPTNYTLRYIPELSGFGGSGNIITPFQSGPGLLAFPLSGFRIGIYLEAHTLPLF